MYINKTYKNLSSVFFAVFSFDKTDIATVGSIWVFVSYYTDRYLEPLWICFFLYIALAVARHFFQSSFIDYLLYTFDEGRTEYVPFGCKKYDMLIEKAAKKGKKIDT